MMLKLHTYSTQHMKNAVRVNVIIVILLSILFSSTRICMGKEFNVGETYVYSLEWLGIPVATMTACIRAEGEMKGREIYILELKGKTNRFSSMIYRVNDYFVSYIDKERKIPLKLEVSRREGFYKKDAVTIFDHDTGKAYFENFLDTSKKSYDITSDTQDVLSIYYLLRNVNIALGEKLSYNVAFAETVFTVYGVALHEKSLEMPWGTTKNAFYIKPHAKVGERLIKDGKVACYFSNDGYHVPLRIILKAPLFTTITAYLVEVRNVETSSG